MTIDHTLPQYLEGAWPLHAAWPAHLLAWLLVALALAPVFGRAMKSD